MGFFGKLTEAMGENVKLVPEVIHEGKPTTPATTTAAAAVWHLGGDHQRNRDLLSPPLVSFFLFFLSLSHQPAFPRVAEWNGERIPFTRGCGIYEFSPEPGGGGLRIR